MSKEMIIIFYQADCSFCNVCRHFIERRDIRQQFIFKDIHETCRELGADERIDSIRVVDGKNSYTKFQACLYIGKHLQNPWPYIVSVLNITPDSIGDFGYDWISKHRDLLMKCIKIFD